MADRTINMDANGGLPMTESSIKIWALTAAAPDRERALQTSRAFATALSREYSFELIERADTPLPPGVNLHDDPSFSVTWTSGIAAANCAVITGTVRRYTVVTKRMPHVITTAGDPPSVLACCRALHNERACELTILPIRRNGMGLGSLEPSYLKSALRSNTCLVTIAAVSADTGTINNLRKLAAATSKAHVPFHSDVTQLIGRSAFRPAALGIDSWTASFEHIRGAPMFGVLAVRRSFAHGYSLASYIGGAQNASGELRATGLGDPDALIQLEPALAATTSAWRTSIELSKTAQTRMGEQRDLLYNSIARAGRAIFLDDCEADIPPSIDGGITPPGPRPYLGTELGRTSIRSALNGGGAAIVWIAPYDTRTVLPNTLLISICAQDFSAEAVRAQLSTERIIVGRPRAAIIGALCLPLALRQGLLRFSLHQDTTSGDIMEVADKISRLIKTDRGNRERSGSTEIMRHNNSNGRKSRSRSNGR